MEGFVFSGTKISAFGGSRIPQLTIEAYLATEYRVTGERPLVLHIGQPNVQLAALYRSHSADRAAVLTTSEFS